MDLLNRNGLGFVANDRAFQVEPGLLEPLGTTRPLVLQSTPGASLIAYGPACLPACLRHLNNACAATNLADGDVVGFYQ